MKSHLATRVLCGTLCFLGGTLSATADGPLAFQEIAPCRLVDTRTPDGPLGGPAFGSGMTRTFPVQTCIPSEAAAAYVTVTAIAPSAQGHLRLFDSGSPIPGISSVNFAAGSSATANGTLVPLGSGSLSVYAVLASAGSVHVTIDVTGWYAEPTAVRAATWFFGLPSCRLVDTRNPASPSGGPALVDGEERPFPVSGRCGVPEAARAVAVTATAVSPTGNGHLAIDTGSRKGPTSTVNFPGGVAARASPTIARLVPVRSFGLAAKGVKVQARVAGGGSVHFVLDVTGYYKEQP